MAAIARRIVGFESTSELPGREVLREHVAAKLNAKELAAVDNSEQRPYGRTKIGWADWIQSAEAPRCETCDAKMRFVLQLQGGGRSSTSVIRGSRTSTSARRTRSSWRWAGRRPKPAATSRS